MNVQEFNLCDEKWICVIDKNYHTVKESIPGVLLHSHLYVGLSGETESQNAAVLRFLIAILLTIFCTHDETGAYSELSTQKDALHRWGAIWSKGSFPDNAISDYLNKWHDRFWLFDSVRPFYQTPGIQGTENPAKKLNGELVESSNKVQLFSMRNGSEKNRLSFDEAARWLLHIQSFGDTAAKKPSPKMCWTGSLGLITAEGDSLFETLMLNLTLLKNGMELWNSPHPAWECEEPETAKLVEKPLPDNYPELLTMQCRRILLEKSDDAVVGYVEAAGDYTEKESAFSEQMTLWEKRTKGDRVLCLPKVHNPARQMWRDFSSVVGSDGVMPGVVAWISRLKKERKLDKNRMVSFRIYGIIYGSMCCGITDEFSDSLKFHTSLLDDLGLFWQKRIEEQIKYCDSLAEAVRNLARCIDIAAGGDGTAASRQAEEQAYYMFDIPFRNWLLKIDPDSDMQTRKEILDEWKTTARKIIMKLGQEIVDGAGLAAIGGRNVTEKKGKTDITRHYSAPEAFNQFLYRISCLN